MGAGKNSEKPYTGVGRHGTAPPLTSHGGRSPAAERQGGKPVQDAVTKGCHAVLLKFIGNPEYLQEESDVLKMVRKENGGASADAPDSVIVNRFRNIIGCSSALPPAAAAKWEQMKAARPEQLLNKKQRRHLKRKAAAEAAQQKGAEGGGPESNKAAGEKAREEGGDLPNSKKKKKKKAAAAPWNRK